MKSYKTAKGTDLPILNLRGKEYLEVKYRLVWFREEKPEWSIETELIQADKDATTARATIKNPDGRIMAMGHKFETTEGFADHKEKAETGAIGRALALLGYGTQFCADELDEGERVVDAPVPPKNPIKVVKKQIVDEAVDPGEYVATFGKFKQQKLKEIDIYDLASYVAYIEKQANENQKEITGQVAAFMIAANKFLNSRRAAEEGA